MKEYGSGVLSHPVTETQETNILAQQLLPYPRVWCNRRSCQRGAGSLGGERRMWRAPRGTLCGSSEPKSVLLAPGAESANKARISEPLVGATGFECGAGSSCCRWQEGSWKERQRLFSGPPALAPPWDSTSQHLLAFLYLLCVGRQVTAPSGYWEDPVR